MLKHATDPQALAMVLEGLAAVRPGLFPLLSLLELEESNLPGCTLL